MDCFAKIVDCIQLLTIFAKVFILFVSQCYEYASDKTKQNLVRCHLFNKRFGLQSAKFIFKFNFIITLLPCRETLITNLVYVPFLSN